MTTVGPLEKPDAAQVAEYLQQRVGSAVGFDVWVRAESELVRTDRDSCLHCDDVVQLGRQLASLHPALSVTMYDLEKHASRAEEAGVSIAPTMILRGAGRSIWFVGLFSGMLFPALLDLIGFISQGQSPLTDETRVALAEIDEPVEIELMLTPFDPYSAFMARVIGSLADDQADADGAIGVPDSGGAAVGVGDSADDDQWSTVLGGVGRSAADGADTPGAGGRRGACGARPAADRAVHERRASDADGAAADGSATGTGRRAGGATGWPSGWGTSDTWLRERADRSGTVVQSRSSEF